MACFYVCAGRVNGWNFAKYGATRSDSAGGRRLGHVHANPFLRSLRVAVVCEIYCQEAWVPFSVEAKTKASLLGSFGVVWPDVRPERMSIASRNDARRNGAEWLVGEDPQPRIAEAILAAAYDASRLFSCPEFSDGVLCALETARARFADYSTAPCREVRRSAVAHKHALSLPVGPASGGHR